MRMNEGLQASFRRVVELESLAIIIARELQAIEDEVLALGIELYGEEFERFAERVYEDYASESQRPSDRIGQAAPRPRRLPQ
jgi:hypothetical protein